MKLQRALDAYARAFQRYLPSPFAIAVLLTLLAAGLSLRHASAPAVLDAWVHGLWDAGLLRFGFQAMFMLVLGHVLALAPPVLRVLHRAVRWTVEVPALAPAKVALLSMLMGWLNWGLGLIAGAILVRGVLDGQRRGDVRGSIHPGVLGAAGYTGLLVWHGGLSGSAPLKVAEHGHMASLVPGASWASELPDAVTLRETVLSAWSLGLTVAVVVAVVAVFRWLGARTSDGVKHSVPGSAAPENAGNPTGHGTGVGQDAHSWADRLDTGRALPWMLGAACFGGAWLWAAQSGPWTTLAFVTPDWINLMLLGLALVAHGSVRSVLRALDEAISGATGILIQFPLYFGIMGMVTGTGLGAWLAEALVGATPATMLPEALFVASGVLNVFVPSGGGQWAVQGPLVLEACHALGVPVERGIMAMAFGDELTNMLQPFWALPLLGITGLSARDILPYTLLVMAVAGAVIAVGMAFWV